MVLALMFVRRRSNILDEIIQDNYANPPLQRGISFSPGYSEYVF